ncbi:hypothetical protein FDV58_29630 [Bradyrhizobium elkanii]|uniref:Uncharacterized protein n=1 Tax=Bradyrhizobium elkanii TaxID=29448 RepID=A0A4U6RSD8_BRAEL|nr:hypothetical protein FDV58_29630 [Bradyrhizobium elkanii]
MHWDFQLKAENADVISVALQKINQQSSRASKDTFCSKTNAPRRSFMRAFRMPRPSRCNLSEQSRASLEETKKLADERSKRIEKLFGDCLKLRLLMPIMAGDHND